MRHRLLDGVVVGLGAMGSNHLRVLEAMRDVVRVVAVVDVDPERLRATRAGSRVQRCSSLDEALEEAGPDFVCLAAPVAHLPALAEQAVQAGVAVLVEKPMAPDEESARALIELARSRGVLLSVGHVERFNPAVKVVKEQLESGRVGGVFQMQTRRLGLPSRRATAVSVALDLATHDLDVMRYLAGSEVSRVAAEAVQQRASLVAEALVGVVRFDAGAIGLLEVSRLAPQKVRELVVVGERCILALDYIAQTVVAHEHGADPRPLHVSRAEPLTIQWERFVDALRRRTAPDVDGFDGLAALSSARALQLSALRGKTVVPAYRALDRPLRAAV